jgi:hypothetical protein
MMSMPHTKKENPLLSKLRSRCPHNKETKDVHTSMFIESLLKLTLLCSCRAHMHSVLSARAGHTCTQYAQGTQHSVLLCSCRAHMHSVRAGHTCTQYCSARAGHTCTQYVQGTTALSTALLVQGLSVHSVRAGHNCTQYCSARAGTQRTLFFNPMSGLFAKR